jgi:hypothetical protein
MDSIALLTRGYISPIQVIVAQVPLPPAEAQSLLVKALELPLPPSLTTEVTGIHQSDVVIRSAIIAAIADLRANPWLLDYVFASLPKDSVTMADYGEREIAAAKKWFMSTNIPVFMSTRIDDVKLPAISISLLESTEAETTLGDTHYKVTEDNDSAWPALAGPFSPVEYSAATGIMKIPETIDLILAPGMVVVDSVGRAHEILEVPETYTLQLKAGTVGDFTDALIKGTRPSYVANLESVVMKETYSIGCHVNSEQTHLTYLHSILTFILLRYKESLLEARGFERSQINSSDFRRNESFDVELAFSRHLNITGYVRQIWPKAIKPKLTGLAVSPLMVIDSGKLPADADPNAGPDEASWIGDQDALTAKIGK